MRRRRFHLDDQARRVDLGEVRPSRELDELVHVQEVPAAENALDCALYAAGEAWSGG